MGRLLALALAPSIESVETVLHQVEDGELRRTLRFQASAPLSIFKGVTVAREALCWETFAFYRLADHTSTWEVKPREQYRRYFRASGTYHLEAIPEGRTRRVVAGDLEILVPVPMVGGLVERVAPRRGPQDLRRRGRHPSQARHAMNQPRLRRGRPFPSPSVPLSRGERGKILAAAPSPSPPGEGLG